MFKKLIAYSFIFLANLAILAHAVLPHHHHEQQVCFERAHCTDDAEAFSHNSTEHNHQHDATDNTTCVLSQAVIIPLSQTKSISNCDHRSGTDNHDFFIISNFGYDDFQSYSETKASAPEFHSFLISFVTTSLGLRAPPIV
jgi:hypothetical protein